MLASSPAAAPDAPGSPLRQKLPQRQQSLSGGRQQQQPQQQRQQSQSGGWQQRQTGCWGKGGSGCDQLRNQLCCDMGFMAELVSAKGKAEMAVVLSKQVWNGVWVRE